MAHCCAPEAQSRQPLSEVLESAAGDPTLQDCCARDLREQAYASWLKGELLDRDRTNFRRDIAASVIRPDALPADLSDLTDERSSEDEGDKAELQQLRERRIAELALRARKQAEVLATTSGRLRDGTAEELPILMDRQSAVVCHFYIPGDQTSSEIDELLSRLALQHRSAGFWRIPYKRHPKLVQWRIQQAGLVCFLDGSITDRLDTADVVGDGLAEHLVGCSSMTSEHSRSSVQAALPHASQHVFMNQSQVVRRLRKAGMLHGVLSTHKARASSGCSSQASSEDEADEWQAPCATCGRRYPHEHIRGMRAGTTISDSDSEVD